jgi:hypothetical protein
MAQSIPYGLEGSPLAQQANGQRMAKTMSPLGGNLQSTAPKSKVEDVVHTAGTQRTEGGAHAKEEFAPRARSTPFSQVALQGVPDFVGQGQKQRLASLALGDSQNSGSPVDIVQSQRNHFAAS